MTASRPMWPCSRFWMECDAPGTTTSLTFGAVAASCCAHSSGVDRSWSPFTISTGTFGSGAAVSVVGRSAGPVQAGLVEALADRHRLGVRPDRRCGQKAFGHGECARP